MNDYDRVGRGCKMTGGVAAVILGVILVGGFMYVNLKQYELELRDKSCYCMGGGKLKEVGR